MILTNAGLARVIRTGSIKSGITHVALFTASPGAGGSMSNEHPNSAGYSRQGISWTNLTAGIERNSNTIQFVATGNWSAVNYVGFVSSSSYGGGTMYAYAPLTATRTLTNGARIRFLANSIEIEAANE